METSSKSFVEMTNDILLQHRLTMSDSFVRHLRAHRVSPCAAHQGAVLRLSRFAKKFQQPDDSEKDTLADECKTRYLRTEQRISRLFHDHEGTLSWLEENADLVRSVRREILCIVGKTATVEWDYHSSPGETFYSTRGDVSDYSKLAVNQWTCTRKAFPFFVKILASNHSLRTLVHMKFMEAWAVAPFKWNSSHLFEVNVKQQTYHLPLGKLSRIDAENISFKEKVRFLTKFVSGSRFSTVAKDNDKRRPINIESLGSVLSQRAIGVALARRIDYSRVLLNAPVDRSVFPSDVTFPMKETNLVVPSASSLAMAQFLQKGRLHDPEISTIDFSDASDSILVEVIELLWPEAWVKLLLATRSSIVCFGQNDDDEKVYLRKLSSMGNGFTFEVLTITLLALARAVGDRNASVFGDDVIISNNCAQAFVALATTFGFVVNVEKSFIRSPMRESCGGYFYNDQSLVSYDIEWAKNPLEATANINKVFVNMSQEGPDHDFWKELWKDLLRTVDTSLQGPPPSEQYMPENLVTYVWNPQVEAVVRDGLCSWLTSQYHRPEGSVRRVSTWKPSIARIEDLWYLTGIDKTRSRRLGFEVQNSWDPSKDPCSWAYYGLLLKTGTLPERYRRGDISWDRVTIFVDEHGYLMTKKMLDSVKGTTSGYLHKVFEVDRLTADHWGAWHVKMQRELLGRTF